MAKQIVNDPDILAQLHGLNKAPKKKKQVKKKKSLPKETIKEVPVVKEVVKEVIKEVPVEKIVTVEKIVEKIVEKEVEVKPKKQYNKKSLFTPAQEPVQAGGVTDDGEIDKDS